MDKPDDISQDMREKTERIARWIVAASNCHTDDLQTISEPIARAIIAATLAERGACETVARDRFSNPASKAQRVAQQAGLMIAESISKRGD